MTTATKIVANSAIQLKDKATSETKSVNVKGDVVSTPIFTVLNNRCVTEFKFRRYGLVYQAKIYSSKQSDNLAWRKYMSLKEGDETVLYNAKYQEVDYVSQDGRQGTAYQIVVNG